MPSTKAQDEGFIDFISYIEENGDAKKVEQFGSKQIQMKRLEQSFIPLVDTMDHSDIVGENMKLVVNKEGDTIISIDIECGCGRKSRLVFEYE